MKKAWDIINDIHNDKNENLYKWSNSSEGTYFGTVFDVKNFGFGKDYVFYQGNGLKWCENLDIEHCEVSLANNSEIQFIDRDNNCLVIGIRNVMAETYLED